MTDHATVPTATFGHTLPATSLLSLRNHTAIVKDDRFLSEISNNQVPRPTALPSGGMGPTTQ
ncbi:MAG: hypothetical protein KF861_08330 [Planctomycetaceae bacterium]|nr:hypothetical protein [Planctomycetaceae bacterium]